VLPCIGPSGPFSRNNEHSSSLTGSQKLPVLGTPRLDQPNPRSPSSAGSVGTCMVGKNPRPQKPSLPPSSPSRSPRKSQLSPLSIAVSNGSSCPKFRDSGPLEPLLLSISKPASSPPEAPEGTGTRNVARSRYHSFLEQHQKRTPQEFEPGSSTLWYPPSEQAVEHMVEQPLESAQVEMELEKDVVHPGEGLVIRWETDLEDPWFDQRHWDFLALHQASDTPDHYDSSLYTLGVDCGMLEFCAPPTEGEYAISAVRDMKIVWRNLPHGHIKKQLQSHYGFRTKHLYQEHLISLGSVFFEVRAAIPGEVDDNMVSDNASSL